MKVVFLDIDGVLNSLATRPADPSGLAAWLDPANVRPFAEAMRATGASIVLSSSWRLSTALDDVRRIFSDAGCVAPVIGVTPTLGIGARDREILAWLEGRTDVEDWVAIDDDFLEAIAEKQIRCSRLSGFTHREADKLLRELL